MRKIKQVSLESGHPQDTHLAESLSTEWSITMEISETKFQAWRSVLTFWYFLPVYIMLCEKERPKNYAFWSRRQSLLDNQDNYILCHQYHYNLQLVGFVELTIQAVTWMSSSGAAIQTCWSCLTKDPSKTECHSW